uniref:Uncharacterized protein n=1 Tax=uncultured bacterium contig00053 TaxID=1181537 RepID=A0A806KFK9_9BACT|nr:hypothetical protein [uncultured bacterium contig00053]
MQIFSLFLHTLTNRENALAFSKKRCAMDGANSKGVFAMQKLQVENPQGSGFSYTLAKKSQSPAIKEYL